MPLKVPCPIAEQSEGEALCLFYLTSDGSEWLPSHSEYNPEIWPWYTLYRSLLGSKEGSYAEKKKFR